MSDTTRNDGTIYGNSGTSPAPAPQEPESLGADAPLGNDSGAHAASPSESTETPAAAAPERPAAVPYEDPAYDPPVTHDPPAVEVTERAAEPVAVPAPTSDASTDAPTEAYAPAVAGATAAGSAAAVDDAPTQQYPDYSAGQSQPAPQTPIYVQAPTPPKNRGNRGPGILIALLATVAYAALFALVVSVISGITSATLAEATETFAEFIVRPVFYVPVIFFFLAFAALIAIVNRAGWWAYVLGGFLVAVVVYFSYIGGALLTVQAWNLTPSEAGRFVSTQWLNPGAVTAAILAREVPIWFGSWIARNGRKVTERNAEARKEYDRQLAEGPQLVRQ